MHATVATQPAHCHAACPCGTHGRMNAVTTSDGVELAYRVAGVGAGVPMLTVHGLVSTVHHWKYFTC